MHYFLFVASNYHYCYPATPCTSLALSIPSQEVFALYIYITHSIWLITSRQPVTPRCAFSFFSTFAVNGPYFPYFTSVNSVPVAVKHFNTLYTCYITQLLVKLIKSQPSGWLPPHCCYQVCFLTEKIEIFSIRLNATKENRTKVHRFVQEETLESTEFQRKQKHTG